MALPAVLLPPLTTACIMPTISSFNWNVLGYATSTLTWDSSQCGVSLPQKHLVQGSFQDCMYLTLGEDMCGITERP